MALAFNDMSSTRRTVGITPEFNRAYSRTYGTIRSRINAGTFDPLGDWKKMTFDMEETRRTNLAAAEAGLADAEYKNAKDKKRGGDGNDWDQEISDYEAQIEYYKNGGYAKDASGAAYDKAGYSSAERAMFDEMTQDSSTRDPGIQVF